MSDDILKQHGTGKTLPRAAIIDMMLRNVERLPDLDKKLLNYGPFCLAGNGGLAGLFVNSLYRRALNVKPRLFVSSAPMAVLPFMTTLGLYNAAVAKPLLSGDLKCPSCALIRGALVGVVGGGLYPILLALLVNVGLASSYNTVPMPDKRNILRFCVDISRPVVSKMKAVLMLQACFGTYLSSWHYESYLKLVEITLSSVEELKD